MGKIPKEQLNEIMLNWKNSRIRLNNMILGDAKKEFDSNSMIGYGMGEGENGEKLDFKFTRGTYESNSFVNNLMDDSAEVEREYVKITGNLTKTL